MRGAQEEKGWYVFYKSCLYEHVPGHARRFPQQSSPTSNALVPSNYIFWLAPRDDTPEPAQIKRGCIEVGPEFTKHPLDLGVP
jgi:hypothetical protein